MWLYPLWHTLAHLFEAHILAEAQFIITVVVYMCIIRGRLDTCVYVSMSRNNCQSPEDYFGGVNRICLPSPYICHRPTSPQSDPSRQWLTLLLMGIEGGSPLSNPTTQAVMQAYWTMLYSIEASKRILRYEDDEVAYYREIYISVTHTAYIPTYVAYLEFLTV